MHGHNINALIDSMITGGINEIEAPYRIEVLNLEQVARPAREQLTYILEVLSERGAICAIDEARATIELNEMPDVYREVGVPPASLN